MNFEPFGKIPRLLNLPMLITEKIDGTNAQIYIEHIQNIEGYDPTYNLVDDQIIDGTDLALIAGSRNRWLKLGDDNFGFADWVSKNWKELIKLGPGRHFGEWWGSGIQRGYNLREKRFSLFNTGRWSNPETRPACCTAVPVLYYGDFNQEKIIEVKETLLKSGSQASPGFVNPEGIIIYLPKANMLFKSTYNGDTPKGSE